MKNNKIINLAVETLKQNGVIVFPTDTVWGIGCSIESLTAIERLYQIKGRDKNKPTAVLVNSLLMAKNYGEINQLAQKFINKYWPGGLTIVVKAKNSVPQNIQGENGTVGLRMPKHKTILDIISQLNYGLVAGSANFNKQPTPFKKSDLNANLLKLVDLIIDGNSGNQTASTVIDISLGSIKILRQGSIKIPSNF